jgi:DNA-binding response OmpR family regulator
MRILVIEDEPRLADVIARALRMQALAVDIARDGQSGLNEAASGKYGLVILDRDLPELHGDEVCIALQDDSARPRILMLTASGEVEDRVRGLAIGADDYLPKPFALAELRARVMALMRRPTTSVPTVLERKGIRVDPHHRTADRDGRPIELRDKEFAVLTELMRADGAPVSVETLLCDVWDENADPFSNVVRVTVMRLRRALGDPGLIETVSGGYRFK